MPNEGCDLALVVRSRMQDREVQQIDGDLARARQMYRKLELAPEVEDQRAGLPCAREHIALPSSPFGERADDPFVALDESDLDLADRHPVRRADSEPRQADLHADRAAPRPEEPIVDGLSDEHDATKLAFLFAWPGL